MGIQTATTGELENAQGVVIAQCRFTMEHSMPCVHLVEHFTLPQGSKSITVPKVAQMTASNLTDGVDIVDTEDIGMTTRDLTSGEVGLKVILTDKLVRQESQSPLSMIGVQMGDAMGRKKDGDVIALFTALNGATTLGADNKNMTLANLAACIARAKSNKYPAPIVFVHHPNAFFAYTTSAALTPAATYPLSGGLPEDLLGDFYRVSLNQVMGFEDGNIAKVSGVDSGYGAIFSRSALCTVESQGFRTETERDASLRGTEVVVTADYGCFELDDSYGAPMLYEIADPSTSA
jgi:hypothetical protein